MKSSLFLRLIGASALFLLASTGRAQTTGKEPEYINTSFSVLSYNQISTELWYIPGPRQPPRQLTSDTSTRSALTPYRGPNVIEFFAEKPLPPAKDQPPVQPACAVTVPQGVERALVILYEIKPGVLKGIVLDDTGKAFPGNSYRLLNLSGAALALRIGTTDTMVAAGANAVEKITSFNASLPLKLAMRRGERWIEVNNDTIRFTEGARYLLMAASNPATPNVPPSIRIIPEYPQVAAPAKPGQTQPGQKPQPGKPAPNAR